MSLQVRDLTVGYGGITALKNVSLEVNSNEIVAILGSNGSGKSTLMKTISGLLKPWSGSIVFDGKKIDSLPPYKIVEEGIVLVQEGAAGIFPNLSVRDNLYVASQIRRAKKRRIQSLESVLAFFPRLKERIAQKAGTLSGGERQMLKIAMALMAHAKLLLLDEPSHGLAPRLVDELFDKVQEIHDTEMITVLLVEQDAARSLEIADRGYVIENGSVVAKGEADKLISLDAIKKAYLGI